ncbi:dUTP diphosphatase [Candidatus Woesearchaeota archaeon]|nr:dUTP diphosphatase [Candidatus Woesearchaeota archaeon]
MVEIKIQKIADVKMPHYVHEGDSGMDIYAAEDAILEPGERKLVSCGFRMAIPVGYEAQVRPKSGPALKHGISLVNTPGTIDAGYRGDVGVILINFGKERYEVKRGLKVAQMVITKVEHALVSLVGELDKTARGEGGFGSTGL